MLPSTVSDLVAREVPPPPAGIQVEQLPIIIGKVVPNDLKSIHIFIDESALGYGPSSIEDLKSLAAGLPLEATLKELAVLAAQVAGAHGDRSRQFELAKQLFDEETAEKARVFLALHENSEVFCEQHCAIALQIVLSSALGDPEAVSLDDDQFESLIQLISGCGTLISESVAGLAEVDSDPSSWMAFFVRNGAYFSEAQPLGELARFYYMLTDLALSAEMQEHPLFCPIDEWMIDAYGLSIEEQFAVGFALSAMTASWDEGVAAGTSSTLEALVIDDMLNKLGLIDRKDRVLALISSTPGELAAAFDDLNLSPTDLAWEVRPLKARPFVRLTDGSLVLTSPRALQSWLAEGFHFRLLTHAQGVDKELSGAYLAFAGAVLEKYMFELFEHALGERGVAEGRLYGEQPYEDSGQSLTSDLAMDFGLDAVLVEVSGSRLRATTVTGGNEGDVLTDLQKMFFGKAQQVYDVAEALVAEKASIPADKPELNMDRVAKIWPIVVTAGTIFQNGVLWKLAAEQIVVKGAPRTQALLLASPDEAELIAAMIEAGEYLPAILEKKAGAGYAHRDLRFWLSDDPTAPRGFARSSFVERNWQSAIDQIDRMVDMDIGIQD